MRCSRAVSKQWALQFVSPAKREADPLMGWTSSDNTRQQVLLKFDTKEEAIAYAQREGYAYVVEEPRRSACRPEPTPTISSLIASAAGRTDSGAGQTP